MPTLRLCNPSNQSTVPLHKNSAAEKFDVPPPHLLNDEATIGGYTNIFDVISSTTPDKRKTRFTSTLNHHGPSSTLASPSATSVANHPPNIQPQNEYIERAIKQHGRRLDHEERTRKKAAREGHKQSEAAQNLRGLRAKLNAKKRHAEKIQLRKTIKSHEERNIKGAAVEKEPANPIPSYLLDRASATNAKALSSQIKNKRAEKAAKFSVPLPKVRGISEEEMFRVWRMRMLFCEIPPSVVADRVNAGCENWKENRKERMEGELGSTHILDILQSTNPFSPR